jgi:hypothetical protein
MHLACQFNPLNRLTNLVWGASGTALAGFGYTLGPTGNRTGLTEMNNGVRTYAWGYDNLFRLKSETITGAGPAGSLTYGYDDVGNRQVRTTSGFTLTNQSFTFNNDDRVSTDHYDNDGNTVTNATGQPYGYDVEDRLVSFNGQVSIGYNGDGVRTSKTVGGTTTYYLVSDRNPTGYAQVVEEFTVTGTTNVNRRYTVGSDLIGQSRLVTGSWVTHYYGLDGHGSVRFLSDLNGAVTDTYAYDAFGNLIGSSGSSTPNNYLYCGEQYDSDLGFYQLRARYIKGSGVNIDI